MWINKGHLSVLVIVMGLFPHLCLAGLKQSDDTEIERLSRNVIPSKYRLYIETYLNDNNFSFHGEVWIDIEVEEATDQIRLHCKDLNVIKTTIEAIPSNRTTGKEKLGTKKNIVNLSSTIHLVDNTTESSIPTTLRPYYGQEITNFSKLENVSSTGPTTSTTTSAEKNGNVWSLLFGVSNANTALQEQISVPVQVNNTNNNISSIWSLLYEKPADGNKEVNKKLLDLESIFYFNDTSPATKEDPVYTYPVSVVTSTNNVTLVRNKTKPESNTEEITYNRDMSVGVLLYSKPNVTRNKTTGIESTKKPPIKVTSSTVNNVPTNSNKVSGNKTDTISIKELVFDKKNDFVIVKLTGKLKPKMKYRLYLKYTGKLSNDLTGYYKISYKDTKSNQTRWMSATVFEPTEARRAFPCFDEPSFKANFQVNLARPKGMTTLSNMGLVKTKPMIGQPNWEVDVYYESPLMSTYLVAFHVGNLKSSNSGSLKIWTRPSVVRQQIEYALEAGNKFENYFEDYFGIKNPLKKTDIIALPNFISDALENWGLISFEEKYILYQPGVSTTSSQQTVATVLAHELAHTWFGNMVTMNWWANIWLNEGFATYFGTLAVDHVHPDWDFRATETVRAFLKVFSRDALYSSHPLIAAAEKKSDLHEIFDTISYHKGYYILRMIHNTLGDATFRKGIRRYLKRHAFNIVTQDDPWDSFTKQAHEDGTLSRDMDLNVLMDNWTKKTGYPVVTVIRDYVTRNVELIQNRFLRAKDDVESRIESETEETSWWIPLTYTTEEESNFSDARPRLWLDPQELVTELTENMPSNDHWLLMNINASGLYRVKYDLHNWELLSRYLNSNNYHKISVLNRAQLIDDVLDFARAGEVPYPVAMNMTLYLDREEHYLPWLSALSNLDYIQRMLRSTNATEAFKNFFRSLISPTFNNLGFEYRADESVLDSLNRQQIVRWACQTGVENCIKKSVSMFKRWMDVDKKNADNNPITSNLRQTVYCTAVEYGNETEWLFLWNKYLTTTISSERSAILSALGCTRATKILKRYLEISIDEKSGVRKQDSLAVFNAVAKNDLGLNLAKTFLLENVKKIRKFAGETRIPVYLDSLASSMNQQSQFKELERFEQEHLEDLRTTTQNILMSNEKLKFNIEWLRKNYDPIAEWLQTRK